MSNANQPVGFEPAGECLRIREYTADTNAIYAGDCVSLNSNGTVDRSAASSALVGVAMSYSAASGKVLVADHPDQEFKAQADDATIDAQTDMNLNYDIVVGSPDTSYKRSGMQIDASTQATTATLPIKVLRLDPTVNNALGDKAKVICKINNHQLNSGTGTAGV